MPPNTSLTDLFDFQIAMDLWRNDLGEPVESTSTDLVISRFLQNDTLRIYAGFIDRVSIGSWDGFRITSGVEACGQAEHGGRNGDTRLSRERR
jgi:hypothetical protein